MTPIPKYIVFGAVKAADGETYINNATIKLEGYSPHTTTSGLLGDVGVFEFLLVYEDLNNDYALTITAPGYQPYTAAVRVVSHTNLGTIILYEVPYAPSNVEANYYGEDYAIVTWGDPIPAVPKTYILDDGTAENGWRINANYNTSLGNLFNVGENGTITSIDVYGMGSTGGLSRTVTVEIYDQARQYVGTSEPFVIPALDWVNVPIDNLPYSGAFYAMVTWHATAGDTYYLGYDENGPNINNNLNWYYDHAGTWELMHIIAGASGAVPGVFSVRVNALAVGGKGVVYDLKEFDQPATLADASSIVSKANVSAVTGDPESAAGTRAITGYKLWRLLPGQEENPTAWVTLTNNPVYDMSFVDIQWAQLAEGTYKYAVRTSYHGDVESKAAFSNNLAKVITVPFTVLITTQCGASPAGAAVTLTHAGGTPVYTGTATATGVIFPAIALGDYTLKITFAGYMDYSATFTVTMEGTHYAQLMEMLAAPASLSVTVTCDIADLSWSAVASVPNFTGYSVFLNGGVVEHGVQATTYQITGLANCDYIAGVRANYTCGSSIIVTKEFEVSGVGIGEYTLNYGLYPNPTSTSITVERGATAPAIIELYNAMGMHVAKYETEDMKFEINVSALAAGTYFIRVTENGKTGTKSFVKK
jgi:hypothetical protein